MDSIKIFILNSIFLCCYSLCVVFIGGLVIAIIEGKSMRYLRQSFGYYGILLTGLGTVVHELSHLIFVLLGGMKPKEIKLFRPIEGRKDGILGYVSYSMPGSNASGIRRLYNRLFLIPIGIAPIIGGTFVILISLKLCVPTTFNYLMEEMKLMVDNFNGFSLNMITAQLVLSIKIIKNMFIIDNFKRMSFWIFIFIVLSIASHMSLSSADIKGCLNGVPYLFIVIGILNAIFLKSGMGTNYLYEKLSIYNGYVVSFMVIAIVFSLLNLLITFIVNKVIKLIK